MRQNINRIDHVVWIAHLENQTACVRKLSEMFRVEFLGPCLQHHMGMQVCVSWEGGLEVIAPIDEDTPQANSLRAHLKERGEGFFAVVFGVPDIEEARDHMLKLGYDAGEVVPSTGKEPWLHQVGVFKEVIFGEFLGTLMALGEITYPDKPVSSSA
jgi:hypothetical protein